MIWCQDKLSEQQAKINLNDYVLIFRFLQKVILLCILRYHTQGGYINCLKNYYTIVQWLLLFA